MDDNPDIVVEPVEWEWTAETFATQLAGDQLPTTFRVPFTDAKGLAERQQIADVTEYVEALPYADEFNPSVLEAAKGTDGKIYGLPTDVYGVGLHYNRALFEEAGLDPDSPPTSWDEVREYAKQIADETGQPGYVQMSANNTGGWMLTTLTYALGGRMQSDDGTDGDGRQRRHPRRACRCCTTCGGATSRWARTPSSSGAPSTRRSPRARSACTCPAPTCTTRW